MAAGRRRVRLLAILLLFVVVAIVYTRRAQVDTYADYVAEKVVGGGSVLRTARKSGQAQQQPAAIATPAPQTQATSTSSTTPAFDGEITLAPSTTPVEEVESTSSSKAPVRIESTAAPALLPPLAAEEEELPVVIAQGRKAVTGLSTASAIHWTKQPEHFPISSTIQLPTGSASPIPRIQYSGKEAGQADEARLAVIKAATEHAWYGYRDAAFGADEVKPISGGQHNPFNGWGATLVDSLDTLWIMGMKEEFDEAVEVVSRIDFTTSTRPDIPLFETVIRYLGGLVAAYDVTGKQGKYSVLLDKAVELAEVLYSAFDTPNRMPQTFYRWKPAFSSQPHRAGNKVVLAELGSLSLEFTRLAQLTGEPKYYDAIARITDALDEWQNSTRIPGLWPLAVDASGCEKPAQQSRVSSGAASAKQQIVPGGDGQIMEAMAPVQPENGAGHLSAAEKQRQGFESQQELEQLKSTKQPGVGKIIGHGAPLAEGSLDGKTTDQLINELGASKAKRQLMDYETDTDPSKDGHVVSSDSSTKNSTLHKQELRSTYAPASAAGDTLTGQEVCIPRGLGSTSKRGQETFSLGGQSDSTYEYFPKEYLLLGGQLDQYRTMYEYAADASIENLIFRPMTVDNRDLLISGVLKVTVNATTGEYIHNLHADSEHLTCFAGGMFAMGSKIFNRPNDLEIGRKLTDGCVWAYNSTTTGIMPEVFTAVKCEGWEDEQCQWNQTEYWHSLDPYEETRTKVPKVVPAATNMAYQAAVATQTVEVAKHDLEKRSLDELEERGVPAEPAQLEARKGSAPSEDDSSSADYKALPKDSADLESPASGTRATQNAAAQPQRLPVYTPKPPLSHEEFVQKKIADERLPPGFVKIGAKTYILRPEAIESVFYMYRITGEQYWRDMGWKMFESIDTYTRALYGNAAIDDVTKSAPELKDSMESFW
jgi:mannosyl-oligosaccharide alpha-1,2-mannosidase